MLISKKELLRETKISYGQLYRWKRENLIPEEWFLKQPSFTGQETFFPKEKILARICVILELKDKYSLEDLAKMLSPEITERNFTVEDLLKLEEVDGNLIPTFAAAFDKNTFTYIEVLLMIALSEFRKETATVSARTIGDLIAGIRPYCDRIKSTGYIFVLFDKDSDYYATLYKEQTDVFLDARLKIVREIHLDDISNRMKLKYRKSSAFALEAGKGAGQENGGNLLLSF